MVSAYSAYLNTSINVVHKWTNYEITFSIDKLHPQEKLMNSKYVSLLLFHHHPVCLLNVSVDCHGRCVDVVQVLR